MTTISGPISSSPQVLAPAQKSSAEISTQAASGVTGSVNSSGTPASYSDASQVVVSFLLNQQDNTKSSSGDSNSPSSTSSQQPSTHAGASGGGSSGSSTKTITENGPDGEKIELTEDKSGKVISEKVVGSASQTASATTENGATKFVT